MSKQVVISRGKSLFSSVEFVIEGKVFAPKKTNRALLAELSEWRKKVDAKEIPDSEIAYTCLEIYFGKSEEIDNLDPKEAGDIFEALGGMNTGKKPAADPEKDAEKNGPGPGVDGSL